MDRMKLLQLIAKMRGTQAGMMPNAPVPSQPMIQPSETDALISPDKLKALADASNESERLNRVWDQGTTDRLAHVNTGGYEAPVNSGVDVMPDDPEMEAKRRALELLKKQQ